MVDFFNHRAADVVKSETAVNRQNQPRYLTVTELQDPHRYAIPLALDRGGRADPDQRNGKDVELFPVSLSAWLTVELGTRLVVRLVRCHSVHQ